MANLFDYLLWRGDLTLEQDPFNEVDSLILCALSYVRLDGAVPGPGGGRVPLHRAAEAWGAQNGPPPGRGQGFEESCARLLPALAETARFRDMALLGYVDELDPGEEEQFSALTVLTGDGRAYAAFRGTDDTLVGWKEDFNMCYMDSVPSQREAARYLERCAGLGLPLRAGGHSKGGNLAVYAAAFCRRGVQARLEAVYNNDGPGFNGRVLEGEDYRRVRERIHTFVPQSSVVGMLLEHEESYTVVHSVGLGLLQHDPFTWEVLGRGFCRLDDVTGGSRFLDLTLREWVAAMGREERERFVDALFEILGAAGAAAQSEITPARFRSAAGVLRGLKNIDEPTRKLLGDVLGSLFRAGRKYAPAVFARPGEAGETRPRLPGG